MKQTDPLPGRCDEALQLPEMRTVFECRQPADHWGMCNFRTDPINSRIAGSFSIDWWPEAEDEPEDHW